jgi:hypothetical protein
MVDFSQYTGSKETEETKSQSPAQHLRSQPEKERAPGSFQKKQEREGDSGWSGGNMGGGSWAGRSR